MVAFYVLIKGAFVGRIVLYLSKCTLKQQLKLMQWMVRFENKVRSRERVSLLKWSKNLHMKRPPQQTNTWPKINEHNITGPQTTQLIHRMALLLPPIFNTVL